MNNIFAILSFFCILPTPIKDFSQPVQSMFQVDEKPKKEILISLNSSFYRNAKEVCTYELLLNLLKLKLSTVS